MAIASGVVQKSWPVVESMDGCICLWELLGAEQNPVLVGPHQVTGFRAANAGTKVRMKSLLDSKAKTEEGAMNRCQHKHLLMKQ